MKTIKFIANIGVCEGYRHNNSSNLDFGFLVQNTMGELFDSKVCKNYISTIITKTKTIYHKDWGCPVGGEITYNIEGCANPEFISSVNDWKEDVLTFINVLKKELKQSTITIEFEEVDCIYLN
ncbi:hypothetical protein [Thomasclavelia cocleata]|uniref:hypothetical protein n=1 Tax=Thomasclavelia cocleata TaxID=69824 RepID=UPI002432810A|nr:hypothetical protein [Thomasclavelia cocleata]